DAVLYDKENTVYADPAKVRRIDHHGQLFDVQGPSRFRRRAAIGPMCSDGWPAHLHLLKTDFLTRT
ncbi:hypothetical protein, partial [Streptomyces malaysiensis]|uniref:hypothetical protein n=1 Tax=Streptomyces malaysiensis TaxID=92644 RepID=UPI0034228017